MRLSLSLVAAGGSTQCSVVPGQIVGSSQIATKIAVADAGACCDACAANPDCVAYTYAMSTKLCFLKDNVQGNTTHGDRQSGVVPGRQPKDHWNACAGNFSTLPFCNESLPQEQRLADLVQRIQDTEIGAQLTARQSSSVPRIGLPAYYWGTNAIHGLQNVGCLKDGQCPTSFPAPCALGATFNPQNVQDMGEILGVEERAYYNEQVHDSLDTWSPTINLNRDPRWGRNVESFGEDPLVCGLNGAAYTRGLQQEGKDKYLQAVVTLKHWMAYTVEDYHGTTRHNVDSKVSAWDMVTSYLPQWEIAVKEAGAKGVMCSYNMVNGKPTCGNAELTKILREDFGFTGYITSDSDSCADIWRSHHYVKTGEEAVRECLTSGTDIDSGSTYGQYLKSALDKGILNKTLAATALHNSYRTRFQLGLFDFEGSKKSKYASITKEVVGSAAHQQKSLDMARQAMVLLKNDGVLPAKKGQKVAVIGTSVNSTEDLLGNYNGPICPNGKYDCFPTIFQQVAAVSAGPTTVYTGTDAAAAAAAAAPADLVVLVASNAKDGGGEGHDRDSIALAADQQAVITAVLATGKPAVLVLVNGGVIAIDGLKDSAPAILEVFMPGVHGAQAVAETIFGENNPGGKMPVTMYHSSYVNEVDFLDMSMVAGPGRSYKFYQGQPLYEFGYGLSYTTFALQTTQTSLSVPADGKGTVQVTVSNTGGRDGDEVVFVYMTNSTGSKVDTPMPARMLVGYQRVAVQAGASAAVEVEVPAARVALVDSKGVKRVVPGAYEFMVTRGHGDVLKIPVQVTGKEQVLFTLKPWWGQETEVLI